MDSDAKTYFWVIDDEPETDPVTVTDSGTGSSEALDEVRSDFYSRIIVLSESPPFRVLLVHDPGGDLVMLSVNHTAFDGVSSLRLMQSIGRAYARVPDPVVGIDPGEALRLSVPQHGPGVGERIRNARLGVQQLGEMRSRAARVAPQPSAGAGYAVHTFTMPVAPLTKSDLRRRLDATVNDILLAAVHRSIHEWNTLHGEEPGRIAISVPVNARHDAWRTDVIANLITSENVSTTKPQRATPETSLNAIATWTAAVKVRGTGSALAAQTKPWRGRVTQRRAFSGIMRAVAGFLNGTAVVSNLGRVAPDWVDGEEFEVSEIWVSPPVIGTGLSVGAVSVNDVLHLSLRAPAEPCSLCTPSSPSPTCSAPSSNDSAQPPDTPSPITRTAGGRRFNVYADEPGSPSQDALNLLVSWITTPSDVASGGDT